MADIGATSWNEVDASNTAAPPAGWPEGMFPSDVNNSARAGMGATKRFWDRTNSVLTTAGTATAYTLTYTQAAASYYDGEEFSFILNATCGAAPTLNINGIGARQIRRFTSSGWVNLAAGEALANQPIRVRYNLASTAFDVVSIAPAPVAFFQTGVATAWAIITGTTGALVSGFNVASVVHSGTGGYNVTFTTPMSSANYAAVATALGGPGLFAYIASTSTTVLGLGVANSLTQTPQDPTTVFVVCFGP